MSRIAFYHMPSGGPTSSGARAELPGLRTSLSQMRRRAAGANVRGMASRFTPAQAAAEVTRMTNRIATLEGIVGGAARGATARTGQRV